MRSNDFPKTGSGRTRGKFEGSKQPFSHLNVRLEDKVALRVIAIEIEEVLQLVSQAEERYHSKILG